MRNTWDILLVTLLLALLSASAVWFVQTHGYTLYYGDAEAHLNHARRILDSRTPGASELGTVWLPVPHLLMLPFVMDDKLWRTGLAGAIPSATCFVLSGVLLFAAARSIFGSSAAGFAAAGSLALNPNLLYLQSIPMTEVISLACLMIVFYCTVRFGKTQSVLLPLIAGIAASAGSLTRYEGWFLIPFVTVYFLIAAKRRRLLTATLFTVLAITGPLSWLAHNWFYTGDALSFYRGPDSARAIQGNATYPGDGNWQIAWQQFRTAGALVLGTSLVWIGLAGALGALAKKAIWPLIMLALTPAFYIWSVHSAKLPIFVPVLTPFSYYNTRYGLTLLPIAAFAAAALVAWMPQRARAIACVAVLALCVAPWLIDPRIENVLTWKESQVNSVARRDWTSQAAGFLSANYRPGSGIFTTFGDISGIYRQAGIPFHETLTWDNWPIWPAAVARPELFLREEWAVAHGGDPVQTSVIRAFLRGPRYTLQKTIVVKNAPVLEIYRRQGLRGAAAEY